MKKFTGIYAIVLGVGIIGLWTMLIITGNVPEFKTEPVAIAFHLTAEFSMGILSLISGIMMLARRKKSGALYLVSSGLVIYAVVNSSGYYGNLAQWGMVAMFMVVLVISAITAVYIARDIFREA